MCKEFYFFYKERRDSCLKVSFHVAVTLCTTYDWQHCALHILQIFSQAVADTLSCPVPYRNIVSDSDKFKAYEDERNCYYQLIRDRADIFKQEAAQVGLPMLPYRGGFFITIPTDSGTAICEELKKEHIYCIALGNGIRIAACGIPKFQMKGLAGKIYDAMKRLGKL